MHSHRLVEQLNCVTISTLWWVRVCRESLCQWAPGYLSTVSHWLTQKTAEQKDNRNFIIKWKLSVPYRQYTWLFCENTTSKRLKQPGIAAQTLSGLRMSVQALNNLDLNCGRQPTKTEGELMKLVARYVVEMFPNPFQWLALNLSDK